MVIIDLHSWPLDSQQSYHKASSKICNIRCLRLSMIPSQRKVSTNAVAGFQINLKGEER